MLDQFLESIGAPGYRVGQTLEWVFQRNVERFDEMTNLPLSLRRELADAFSLTAAEVVYEAASVDGTVKQLWGLTDGEMVESVLIPTPSRITLCISSQVGCALGCHFCATGYFGFRRHLRPAEIVAQYRDSARIARARFDRPITNVVFMGMGEPFANLEALGTALDVLHRGFEIGARRITVSTVGLVPGIRALAARPEPFALAVSLHAPTHELRRQLVPVERRYPLRMLMEAVRDFASGKRRRVSFEYTMIEGVNDDLGLAESLADLVSGLLCYINLIPFNPIPAIAWRPSHPARVAAFAEALHRRGVQAGIRSPRGRDIAAACGQLRLARAGD